MRNESETTIPATPAAGNGAPPSETPLDAALAYQGTACSSPGKHPRTESGIKNATTDEAAIRDRWAADPEANVELTAGPAPAKRRQFVLHSLKEVLNLPPPTWLIRDVIPVGSQVVLFGPPGNGKSFVALDMALSIATGQPWQGFGVRRGPVVYVVAEGGHGIGKRANAWIRHNRVAPSDTEEMFFVLKPVQLKDSEHIKGLLHQINARNKKPVLIVFDTLARCFVDGEENSARDIGVVVHHAGVLQGVTGAAVLILHHTGRAAKGQERGSTALGGAADVMIKQTQANGIITLDNTKQKDAEECEPIILQLQQIQLPTPHGTGAPLTSCVVVPAGAPPVPRLAALGGGPGLSLTVLVGLNSNGPTSRAWQAAVEQQRNRTVSPRTFQRWRKRLTDDGLVEPIPGSNPPRYRLTAKGQVRATGGPV